jgi:chromosome segregation ATPase
MQRLAIGTKIGGADTNISAITMTSNDSDDGVPAPAIVGAGDSDDDVQMAASQIDSFSSDSHAEIIRLKTVLRAREVEVLEKDAQITVYTKRIQIRDEKLRDQEELLKESKQIIDQMIEDNEDLRKAAKDASAKFLAHSLAESARKSVVTVPPTPPKSAAKPALVLAPAPSPPPSPSRSTSVAPSSPGTPSRRPVKSLSSIRDRINKGGGLGAAVSASGGSLASISMGSKLQNLAGVAKMVTEQERTMTHVASRIQDFKEAETRLLNQIAEQTQQLDEADGKLSAEQKKTAKVKAQQKEMETDFSARLKKFEASRVEWEKTHQQIAEKHNTVLQKYAKRKQECHTQHGEILVLTQKLSQSSEQCSILDERVAVLDAQYESEAKMAKDLTAELARLRNEHGQTLTTAAAAAAAAASDTGGRDAAARVQVLERQQLEFEEKEEYLARRSVGLASGKTAPSHAL